MSDINSEYDKVYSLSLINDCSIDDSIKSIGKLIDLSSHLVKVEGLEKAIDLGKELKQKQLSLNQEFIIDYFIGNAWNSLWTFSKTTITQRHEWEQEEIKNSIINYRKSLKIIKENQFNTPYYYPLITNLANEMSNIGRFVEAVQLWDEALISAPDFSMALANKGYGLFYYGNSLYDKGHSSIFLKYAHEYLTKAVNLGLPDYCKKVFIDHKLLIEDKIPIEYLQKKLELNNYPLGTSKSEIEYRKWCLKNKLFLNPLNDLGNYTIAAQDVLTPPSIITKIDEQPVYFSVYNQLKQEYVSARYLFYDGITNNSVHFSDKDVLLYNTLDNASYSLALEKIKMSYRMHYSLFDKIAYFLNDYLNLQKDNDKVFFNRIWYNKIKNNKRVLRNEFKTIENWPLRGLYWLSKDLFDTSPDFQDSIDPEAKEIADIRHYLEHKHITIQESNMDTSNILKDNPFTYKISRDDFIKKSIKLMKMTRAALIYLSQGVHWEENHRYNNKPKNKIGSLDLSKYDDSWKK